MFDKLFRRRSGKDEDKEEETVGENDDGAVEAVRDDVGTGDGGDGGDNEQKDGDDEDGDEVETLSMDAAEEARLLAFSAVATAMEEAEQLRIKEEAKAEEEAKAKSEEEAKAKSEEEAKAKSEEEAKAKSEEEAKAKSEEEAKAKSEEKVEAMTEEEVEAKGIGEEEVEAKAVEEAKAEEESKAEAEAKTEAEEEAKPEEEAPPIKKLTKVEELRAQAKRVRLEADRMDVILTLEKIEKIEKELSSPKVMEDTERREGLQEQMKNLKKKLSSDDDDDGNAVSTKGAGGSTEADEPLVEKAVRPTLTDEELRERIEEFEKVPKFLQTAVAGIVTEGEEFNVTDVVLKMYQDEMEDNMAKSKDDENVVLTPATQEEIDKAVEFLETYPKFIKSTFKKEYIDDVDLARYMIERTKRNPITQEEIEKKRKNLSWIQGVRTLIEGNNVTEDLEFFIEIDRMIVDEDARLEKEARSEFITNIRGNNVDGQNSTEITPPGFGFLSDKFGPEFGTPTDNLVEGCFPRETRREGEEPSEADAKIVMQEISNNNTWTVTGSPEKVPGGFIIRGSTKYDNGKDLTVALDTVMAKSRVRNKVSIFYVCDPTPVTEEQMEMQDRPPVLFLMGPEVVSDPTPFRNGLLSTIAVGTLWSSAIYPVLGNEKYMKLVQEQISFSDGSMTSNLDFVNDLAFPFFTASLVIYFAHEAAHKFVADKNEMKIGFPTFVPSLITGITGSITKLTAPPKNKQELLDFAVVGPLAGIAVSLVYLYVGAEITALSGPEAYGNLPSLSLAVLRQSSLAGGILEAISPGMLNIPDTAGVGLRSLEDVQVPLHPLAIAGYFGLLVNAVNLLPLGRTDGGRVGLALFGRSGMQVAGFTTSVALVIQGIFYGSDLLLFFFSFAAFFQNQLEIPQQNEVDDVDFSRVLLATAAGFLVLLTLIPMQ